MRIQSFQNFKASNLMWPQAHCNDLHYMMTAYKLHELVSVGKDTYKYLDIKTDIKL